MVILLSRISSKAVVTRLITPCVYTRGKVIGRVVIVVVVVVITTKIAISQGLGT